MLPQGWPYIARTELVKSERQWNAFTNQVKLGIIASGYTIVDPGTLVLLFLLFDARQVNTLNNKLICLIHMYLPLCLVKLNRPIPPLKYAGTNILKDKNWRKICDLNYC